MWILSYSLQYLPLFQTSCEMIPIVHADSDASMLRRQEEVEEEDQENNEVEQIMSSVSSHSSGLVVPAWRSRKRSSIGTIQSIIDAPSMHKPCICTICTGMICSYRYRKYMRNTAVPPCLPSGRTMIPINAQPSVVILFFFFFLFGTEAGAACLTVWRIADQGSQERIVESLTVGAL